MRAAAQYGTVAPAKQPKLPHLHKPSRQDMLHKTVQKCQHWQSTPFWLMTYSVEEVVAQVVFADEVGGL